MCRKPLPPGFDIVADPLLLGRNTGHRQRTPRAYPVTNFFPGTVDEAVIHNRSSKRAGPAIQSVSPDQRAWNCVRDEGSANDPGVARPCSRSSATTELVEPGSPAS